MYYTSKRGQSITDEAKKTGEKRKWRWGWGHGERWERLFRFGRGAKTDLQNILQQHWPSAAREARIGDAATVCRKEKIPYIN